MAATSNERRRVGLWHQCRYLLKRNYWIKKRNKRQSIQELLFPIYMVGILAMIRALTKTEPLPAIGHFPCEETFPTGGAFNWTLGVVPFDESYAEFVRKATNDTLRIVSAHNDSELSRLHADGTIDVGIEFVNGTTTSYTLRFPQEIIATTNDVTLGDGSSCRDHDSYIGNYSLRGTSTQCPALSYVTSGFVALQSAIDFALVRNASDSVLVSRLQSCLFPKSQFQPSVQYLQTMISIYMVMAFSPLVNFLLVNLVTEKEKKVKIGMKMMGLSDGAFWLSWFVTYGVIMLGTTVVITIIAAFAIFPHSNFFIVFVLLFAYGLSVISFSFMLTPFFEKATAAGALGSFATIIFSVLVLPAIYVDLSSSIKWLLSLLSPAAFGFGVIEIIVLDSHFDGAGFGNFVSNSLGSFSIGSAFLMLILDTVLYWFLAFYFDNIVPGEFGQAKPFYFCLTPTYWLSRRRNSEKSVLLKDYRNEIANENDVPVERVPPELETKAAIRIRGLRKVFVKQNGFLGKEKKNVTAIAGLNLTVYEGQITALLGHNGAGKSTLIACLTGLTPCTSGEASVYDLNVNDSSDVDRIRKTTGICPQHDILFELLTTREHLVVFAGIKGVPTDKLDEEVDKALAEVNLEKHKDTMATKLSGGQKRKLSVAMALIGNPKILFLDEPTSGMDPYSRRQLWSLLQSKRQDKVIFLTTHFMDEADILADRKAVLSQGRLQCAGSSLFLKSRFGLGYHLGIVTSQDHDVAGITKLVTASVPRAELSRSHGLEVSFTLPLQDVSLFPQLFANLDSSALKLGVQSYGVAMTTLEEVFLRLEEMEVDDKESDSETRENEKKHHKKAYGSLGDPSRKDDEDDDEDDSNDDVSATAGENVALLGSKSVVRGWALNWQQFKAFSWIRFILMLRNPAAVIFRVLLPPILIVIAVVVSRSLSSSTTEPIRLPLNSSLYLSNATSRTFSHHCDNYPPLKPPLLLNNESDSYPDLLDQLTNLSTAYCFPGVDFNGDELDTYLLDHPYHALAVEVPNGGNPAEYSTFYNDTLIHSLPVGINLINSALYRNATRSSNGISVASYPFPSKNPQLPFDPNSYTVILIVGIAFLLIPSGFGIDVVLDREVRARHQLHVSGLRRSTYWLSTIAIHSTTYLIPVLVMLVLVPALDLKSLRPAPALGLLVVDLLLSLPVQSLFVYILSFLFNKSETVQGVMPALISTLGLVPFIVVAILYNQAPNVIVALHYVFMVLIPPYTTMGSLWFITVVYQEHVFDPFDNDLSAATYFAFSSHISPALLILIFDIFALSLLLYWLDKRSIGDQGYICSWFATSTILLCGSTSSSARRRGDVESYLIEDDDSGDDDVRREEELVKEYAGSASSRRVPIMIKGLRKEFPKEAKTCCSCCVAKSKTKDGDDDVKVAVKNLNLRVEKGEIFGLLGPNGAGKTTSLNVFTGDLAPTRGKAYLDGAALGDDIGDAALSLGYCPQIDALWPLVTLREHLTLYALIKGVKPRDTDEMIERFCSTMKIRNHADKRAKALSGGTKRKLSFLVSMMGDPTVLLMDEPSTGMDPSSKRFLWNIISGVVADSKAAILTTHSMEEADALCSRVGIMVAGSLRCVGSTQHLKNKYGGGYHLEIKLFPHHVDDESESGRNVQVSLSTSLNRKAMTSPVKRQGSGGDGRLTEVGLEHGSSALGALMDHVKKTFPGAVQVECFGDRATYSVPREAVSSLAQAFSELERTKVDFGVEEYSFSQATLEQVFISFAKQQFEAEKD